MATMAKWGDFTFKVNSDKLFSFRDMKHSFSARWAAHNIIGKRPKMEFQGANMDEITVEVILDAELGVKPRKEMYRFRKAAKGGKVAYFYVGGKKVTGYKYYIESGAEAWTEIWNKGELVRATSNITFKEYR